MIPVGLPAPLMQSGLLNLDRHFCYERGALLAADWLSLTSPGYCADILTDRQPHPFAGIYKLRLERLNGIAAGVDYHQWSPTTDPHIEQHYDSSSLPLKRLNRERLAEECELSFSADRLLIAYLPCYPEPAELQTLLSMISGLQRLPQIELVIHAECEQAHRELLQAACTQAGDQARLLDSQDEPLRHRLIASADCLLLPAPIQLTAQLAQCALSYGTLPIAKRCSTMEETLVDATASSLLHGVASGFLYDNNSAEAILGALERVTALHAKPPIWWQKLSLHAMSQSFPALEMTEQYLSLYHAAIDNPAAQSPAWINARSGLNPRHFGVTMSASPAAAFREFA